MTPSSFMALANSSMTFFIILTAWVVLLSYYSSVFGSQYDACKDLQTKVAEAVQTNRTAESMALHLRIYAMLSELRFRDTKAPVNLSGIYRKIDQLDNNIAKSSIDAQKEKSQAELLCDNIGADKSKIDRIYIIMSALLAIYGFWVGTRKK